MKIKMLGTHRLVTDGFTIRQYHKGETYDIAESAARVAIKQGWAESAEPPFCFDAFMCELARMQARRAV